MSNDKVDDFDKYVIASNKISPEQNSNHVWNNFATSMLEMCKTSDFHNKFYQFWWNTEIAKG